MDIIEQKTKVLADAQAVLAARISETEDAIRAIKRRRRAGLKSAAARVAEAMADLQAEINGHRELFREPRSKVFHGWKVGLQKGKGKVRYADKAKTVALIMKHLKSRFEQLVKVEKKPVDSAVRKLPASDLARIGAEVVGTGDYVLIKPMDSEIEKLIEAWSADLAEDDVEDAA